MRMLKLAICFVLTTGLLAQADEPPKKEKSAKDYVERGNLMLARRDTDQALADFEEAIKRDPKLTVAYLSRAVLHIQKGDADKALADFDEAVQLDPKNGEILVDANVSRAIENLANVEARGELSLKGFSRTVKAFSVRGLNHRP